MTVPRHPQLGDVEHALPDALILVNHAGRVVDANPAGCRVFGLSHEELKTRDLRDLVLTDGSQVEDYLQACAGSGQPVLGALSVEREGARVVYRCDGAVVCSPGSAPTSTVFIRLRPRETTGAKFPLLSAKVAELEREMASRLRVESLLEGQRHVLELVAGGAPIEHTLAELVRITEQQSPGGQKASILLLDDGGRHLRDGAGESLPAAYREAIDGVEIGPAAGSCGTAAYENRPVVVTDVATDPLWADFKQLALPHGLLACWSTPIRAQDGSVLGTFALYYDEPRAPTSGDRRVVEIMTRVASIAIERRRTEDQLQMLLEAERAARSDAEAANRAKDEFLAMVSHELRNPLNAIMGWVQLLQEGGLGETETAKAVTTIERNARLQGELIADVLDFARITSGRLTLEPVPVLLRSVVEKACESVRPEATARGLDLQLEVEMPDVPLAVDPNRLQQAVSNVLWNAVKFTPTGGQIAVQLLEENGQGLIRIRDTGCGIDAKFLPRVFERFRQSDSTSARQHGGLGLGLTIVRHIVELHGGTVSAHSDGPGTGATFTIAVPIAPVRSAVEPEERRPDPRPSLTGLHILAIDDVTDARELLRVTLTRSGARVTTVASAPEALAVLRRGTPDVLVCDIGLPGIDGYDLIRSWRADERDGRLPAVALTAYSRDVDRRRAMEAGFDRHLSKPFDATRLVAAIAELAAASRPKPEETPTAHDR